MVAVCLEASKIVWVLLVCALWFFYFFFNPEVAAFEPCEEYSWAPCLWRALMECLLLCRWYCNCCLSLMWAGAVCSCPNTTAANPAARLSRSSSSATSPCGSFTHLKCRRSPLTQCRLVHLLCHRQATWRTRMSWRLPIHLCEIAFSSRRDRSFHGYLCFFFRGHLWKARVCQPSHSHRVVANDCIGEFGAREAHWQTLTDSNVFSAGFLWLPPVGNRPAPHTASVRFPPFPLSRDTRRNLENELQGPRRVNAGEERETRECGKNTFYGSWWKVNRSTAVKTNDWQWVVKIGCYQVIEWGKSSRPVAKEQLQGNAYKFFFFFFFFVNFVPVIVSIAGGDSRAYISCRIASRRSVANFSRRDGVWQAFFTQRTLCRLSVLL